MGRWRAVIIVGLVVAAGVGFRAYLAWIGNFGPADLAAYESISGVDLPDRYGEVPFFLTWSRWDGQAYMTIAADPFFEGPSRNLIAPVYRFGRAGYPWLARLVVLGRQDLLPVGLLAVNVVALVTYTILVIRARPRHPKAFWLFANPALFVGVATDTAEPLAFALVMLAVVSASRIAGLAAFGLGVTRESYASVLGISRRPYVTMIAFAVSAIALRSIAAAVLDQSIYDGSSLITWPIVGYLDRLGLKRWPMAALSLLLLAAMVATFIRGLRVRDAWVKFSWLSTGLLGMCLSHAVTADVVNVVRAMGAVIVLWALIETYPTEQGPTELIVDAVQDDSGQNSG